MRASGSRDCFNRGVNNICLDPKSTYTCTSASIKKHWLVFIDLPIDRRDRLSGPAAKIGSKAPSRGLPRQGGHFARPRAGHEQRVPVSRGQAADHPRRAQLKGQEEDPRLGHPIRQAKESEKYQVKCLTLCTTALYIMKINKLQSRFRNRHLTLDPFSTVTASSQDVQVSFTYPTSYGKIC